MLHGVLLQTCTDFLFVLPSPAKAVPSGQRSVTLPVWVIVVLSAGRLHWAGYPATMWGEPCQSGILRRRTVAVVTVLSPSCQSSGPAKRRSKSVVRWISPDAEEEYEQSSVMTKYHRMRWMRWAHRG